MRRRLERGGCLRNVFVKMPEEISESEPVQLEGFEPADDEHIAREKRKAAEMRRSQWWKNQLNRCKCHYCGGSFRPSELTMDHIIPIIRGGYTTRGNVVTACKACNSKKKYLLPSEWVER